MQSGDLADVNWETAIGPCVLWDNVYYRVPSSAVVLRYDRPFVVHPKMRLPSHMDPRFHSGLATNYKRVEPQQIMGRMLVGHEWPKVTQNGDSFGFEFSHTHIIVLKGKMEVDGPEEYVWYYSMETYHESFGLRDPANSNPWERYIWRRLPSQIYRECVRLWMPPPTVSDPVHTLPRNNNARSLNPILNGWKVATHARSGVITLWDTLRRFALFQGRFRAALRAWYNEVHHQPQHQFPAGVTNPPAMQQLEDAMAAPVFSPSALT